MKKIKALSLLILLILPFVAKAQGDVKYWSDGPLTWTDFQAETPIIKGSSYLKLRLTVIPAGNGQYVAVAVMDRNASYADSIAISSRRLRYHQVQFDMLECYRRQLQADINASASTNDLNDKIKEYQAHYLSKARLFDEETRNGADEQKLQEWEYLTMKQLEAFGTSSRTPSFSYTQKAVGFYAGVGGIIPMGAIKDNFGGFVAFSVGLTGMIRDLRLKVDVTYGQPGFKQDNIFKVYDAKGRQAQGNTHASASYVAIGVALGYQVYKGNALSITPNVGGYWSRLSWNLSNYDYRKVIGSLEEERYITGTEDVKLGQFNWIASIDFDIKLKASDKEGTFLGGDRQRVSSSIRITPFVSQGSYKLDSKNFSMKGIQAGISVSYFGLAEFLSKR